MIEFLEPIENACENLVDLVTFGQLDALRQMYLQWYYAHGVSEPNILGYIFAIFVVIVRFAVPIILFYYLFVNKVIRNNVLKAVVTSVFTIVYALFFYNPIKIFEEASLAVTNFYYFLKDLPHMNYEPFIFTFLTNGAIIFAFRTIFVFIAIWIMFAVFLGMFTVIVWLFSGGRSIWSYTDKSFKPLVTQMTIIFLLFYPLFGAFKSLVTVIALTIGAIGIKDTIYTMMGYQKVCYNVGDEVRCKWVK